MRFSSHSSEAHTDVKQPSHNGTNGPTFFDESPLTPMAHCFAHPDTNHSVFSGTAACPGGRQLLNSFSTCSISPFALRSSADVPVACDMADQSPFARLTHSSDEQDTALPPGRCSAPDAALPAAHVQRVIFPRVQRLLPSTGALGVSSFTTAASSDKSSASEQHQSQQEEYPEHHQLDDIMHVMQQHAANPFAMKENAAALTEELRVFLHISSSPASNLGPAPTSAANPTQFICACLHRANLLFILADLLFLQHATVNPETGFGLANTPIASNPRVECVREAEGLITESLALHDRAMHAYWDYVETRSSSRSRSSSPRVEGTAQVPSMMGAASGASTNSSSDHEPCFVNGAAAADLEPELRSSRFVQPRSKVMLRFALIQAALGKREKAVETLHEISLLDPWIPELELRPPEVAHAHRLSVEQAKSGLVWYYNSSHNCLKANRYRDDAMLWKMHRMSQEVHSHWEPADLLPHRAKLTAAVTTDDLRAAHTASLAAAAAAGNDDSRSCSAPLLRRAQRFRTPVPVRDPQAGKSPPEQHTLKLLRDAQEAGDKELTISILARAVEHGAATMSVASPTVLEPLIEHSYHVVSAANPSCATTYSSAVRLLLLALELLRDSCSAGASGPACAVSVERLKLRRRAIHALATALHQNNRVSEPLALHRRALAHALHTSGDPEAVSTLEPRVHIAALSIVRLYMLSEDGSEDLARVADRPDCCEGSWKTLYGRGRPGQNNRFYQPVVKRDNGAEINDVARWLHQQLRMGIRILTIHLLRLAYAATERLQNLPEPSVASSHLPPRLTSPLPSRTPSSANLPLIHEAAAEADSAGSQWGGDTGDLGVDSSTDMATGGHTEDPALSESEGPSCAASNHGIFRHASHKSRVLKLGGGRSVASLALQAAVEESKGFSVEDLVGLLENICEEADMLAREAQTQHGFAVSQPPWVAHLCMPHWKIVHTLLTSNLSLATPAAPPSGPSLDTLTKQLSRVLDIYSDYFHGSGAAAAGDSDSDTLFSVNLSPATTNHTSTSPSPLGAAPTTRPPASEASITSNGAVQPVASPAASSAVIATSQTPAPRSFVPALPASTSPPSAGISSPTPQSSLRLTYRSGSLSVSLPATEGPVPLLVPKPTVESFGLEQDESTSISLGATPIPCMLSVCAGPEGASSSRGCGSPTAADESASDSDANASKAGQDQDPAEDSATPAPAPPAGHEREREQQVCEVRDSPVLVKASSNDDDAAAEDSRSQAPHSKLQHPTASTRDAHDSHESTVQQSCSLLPEMNASTAPVHVTTGPADLNRSVCSPSSTSGSGSPPGSAAPHTPPNPQSTPVAIPPQAKEASGSFSELHAHPFMGSSASSYPGGFADAAGGCGSIPTVPFAPCEHIFGAGGTALCTAALSDPMCVSGPSTCGSVSSGSPPRTLQAAPESELRPHTHAHPRDFKNHDFKNGLEVQPRSFGARQQPKPPVSVPAAAAAAAAAKPDSAEDSSSSTEQEPREGLLFGPDDFNADAFNAVPSELRHTHCRSPPKGAFHAVTAPAIVAAYSCWHTPHIEQDCESFGGDSGSPCSTDVEETVFGSSACAAGMGSDAPQAPPPLPAGTSPLKPPDFSPLPTPELNGLHPLPRGRVLAQCQLQAWDERGGGQSSDLKGCFFGPAIDRSAPGEAQAQERRQEGRSAVVPPFAMHPPPDLPQVLSLDSPPTSRATTAAAAAKSNSHVCRYSHAYGDNNQKPEDATSASAEAPVFMPPDNLAPRDGTDWPAPVRGTHGAHAREHQDSKVPVFVPFDPPHMADIAQPDTGSSSRCGHLKEATALPPRIPSPGMPSGVGAPSAACTATPTCFAPAFTPAFTPVFAPPPTAQGQAFAGGSTPCGPCGKQSRKAGPTGPPPPQGGAQERAHRWGFARSKSPSNMFRPPRPPSPCVSSSGRERASQPRSQSSPGFEQEGEGECGAWLPGGGGLPEPAAFPTPPAVGGSSAPLLRAVEKPAGGAFGGLLWGREGPGSASGHLRGRSVCLDNLDL